MSGGESWQIFEMTGLTADFLPDRFLSSLAGEEEEVDWADWTDWTAAAMAGGMAREASGLPKKGYDMAMEERDDKLELGVVADPEVWTETEAGSRLLEVLALRRFLLLELLLRLAELLLLVVGVAV